MSLNKSLKHLAVQKKDGFKRGDKCISVDPRLLVERPGFNGRDYTRAEVIEQIEKFAQMYANGQYVPPLLVYVNENDEPEVVEGHCRRRGAMLAISRGADIKFLDCVSFVGNDAERVEVMIRSAEGLPLTPLEIALGYMRLSRFGYSNSDIANSMKKTVSHVEQMMILATANADVQALVRSGAVAASTAIDMVRQHGERAGAILSEKFDEAQKQGKTKVMRSAALGQPKIKKAVVTQVVGAVRSFANSLGTDVRRQLAEVEALPEEHRAGKMVQVDAAVLIELLAAEASVKEAEAKAAEKAKAQTQGALEIPGGEDGVEGGKMAA